jgi:hypothetical protein
MPDVHIDSQGGVMSFLGEAVGHVPSRFSPGDKVYTYISGKGVPVGRGVEIVLSVEWIPDVWHTLEPYWWVKTNRTSGPQTGYILADSR